jgi:hypothetical protein
MTVGVWLSLLAALAVSAFVAAPLLRPAPARRQAADDHEALSEARDLASRKDMLLISLKDLEDDRQTDKIDEADFRVLHARLSAEAIEVMRQLDALEARRAAETAAGVARHPASRRTGRPG